MPTPLHSDFTVVLATSPDEVAAALEIRKHVFSGEQEIPARLDADGFDDTAYHVICRTGNHIVATGRLVVVDPQRCGVLARIAVIPEFRGRGLGRAIVRELETVAIGLGLRSLSLHPHRYLEKYYVDLGYEMISGTSTAGLHELITMEKAVGPAHDKDHRDPLGKKPLPARGSS